MLLKCFSCFLLCSLEQSFGLTPDASQEQVSCLSSDIPIPYKSPPSFSNSIELKNIISQRGTLQDAKTFYLNALLAICQGNKDLARSLLKSSLAMNPYFFEARLQLGYLYLWNQDFDEAYTNFKETLALCSCQAESLEALETLAHHFEKEVFSQEKALEIYRQLVQCNPNQVDHLYYLGRLLAWMHEWEESEQVLLECLKISPENSDAGIQLGYLYLWQGRLLEANEQFEKFKGRSEAKDGLEKVAQQERNNPPTLPSPFTTHPVPQDIIIIKNMMGIRCPQDDLSPKDANCLYLEGLFALCVNKNDLARNSLEEAILLDPLFFEAKLQIAYIDLWGGKWQEAETAFYQALSLKPGDPAALEGLESVAHHFEKEKSSWPEALTIYRFLVKSNPNQSDYLYYLGRLLAWMHEWKESEQVLLKCLKISPKNSDAGIQLGYLYLWEGDIIKAKEEFEKFKSRPEAKVGLAKIAEKESDYETAGNLYRSAAKEGLVDVEVGRGIVRSSTRRLKYNQAKKDYQEWIERYPYDNTLQREFLDVKYYTDPSLTSETFFVRAKEDDPTLKIPVVLDYYFGSKLSFHIPIFNTWSVDILGFFGYQKETTVTPPVKINYNVRLAGPELNSHFIFAKDWRLDIFLPIKSAWGIGTALYPFISTTRFEPGTTLLYHSDTQLFSASANISSFIIKDFSSLFSSTPPPAPTPSDIPDTTLTIAPSSLLRVDTIESVYGYTFPVLMNPQVEGNIRRAWYNDSIRNMRTDEDLWIRCGAPYIENNLNLFYHCFHSHFTHLTPNYFSYQEQVISTVGSRLHIDIKEKTYVELAYDHAWWWTKNLIQPIGNTIYVAPLQVLTANRVEGVFGLRIKNTIRSEIKGHYYRNTLPYRDWGVQGNLSWFF